MHGLQARGPALEPALPRFYSWPCRAARGEGGTMPVTPQDRPIDTLREETVDQLIMNYGHGKLSREAFERRLDEALDTKSHDKLLELTRDLDLKADRQYTAQKKAELGIRVEPAAVSSADDTEHVVNIFAG